MSSVDKTSYEFHHPTTDTYHIAFDLDGTIAPFKFPAMVDPYPWVEPLFKFLKSEGHIIWVYSARFNVDFYGGQASVWYYAAQRWLKQHDLYDYVTLTKYKPPAEIIFDDRGHQLIGSDPAEVRSALNRIWVLTKGTISWPEEIIKFADFDPYTPKEIDDDCDMP